MELALRHRRVHRYSWWTPSATAPRSTLLADRDVQVIDLEAELRIARVWKDRWHPDLGPLTAALLASPSELVHLQFNFGFFELGALAGLIEAVLPRKPIVITFHATGDVRIDDETVSLRDIVATLAEGRSAHRPPGGGRRAAAFVRLHRERAVDPTGRSGTAARVPRGGSQGPRARPPPHRRHLRLPSAPQGHAGADRGHRPLAVGPAGHPVAGAVRHPPGREQRGLPRALRAADPRTGTRRERGLGQRLPRR